MSVCVGASAGASADASADTSAEVCTKMKCQGFCKDRQENREYYGTPETSGLCSYCFGLLHIGFDLKKKYTNSEYKLGIQKVIKHLNKPYNERVSDMAINNEQLVILHHIIQNTFKKNIPKPFTYIYRYIKEKSIFITSEQAYRLLHLKVKELEIFTLQSKLYNIPSEMFIKIDTYIKKMKNSINFSKNTSMIHILSSRVIDTWNFKHYVDTDFGNLGRFYYGMLNFKPSNPSYIQFPPGDVFNEEQLEHTSLVNRNLMTDLIFLQMYTL